MRHLLPAAVEVVLADADLSSTSGSGAVDPGPMGYALLLVHHRREEVLLGNIDPDDDTPDALGTRSS